MAACVCVFSCWCVCIGGAVCELLCAASLLTNKGGEMKKRGYSIMCARAQGSALPHGVRETLVVEPFAPLHDLCSNYKVVALYTACITI